MSEIIATIDALIAGTPLAGLHFLRPWWLLSMIPALCLTWFFWRQKSSAANWQGAINEQLLDYLLETGNKHTVRWPWLLLLSAWIITALAIAGPAREKLPQPVHQKHDALIIILDLSLSMHAQDIKPSRLIRARHKILDILEQRDEGLSALIAYSGDAHIVSPLTDDNATIANLLPALTPQMMPVYGSNPVSALHLAQQLLNNSGLNEGRILLITDGITDNDLNDINNSDYLRHFELSILGIGTTRGAPIALESGYLKDDSGNIVVPKLPRQQLDKLARDNGGRYTDVSLNDQDIAFLLPEKRIDLPQTTRVSEREFDQWHDRGNLLIVCLLPIALLAFRRGWLCVLPLLLITQPQPGYAFEWNDLWQRADQQAASALREGDARTAAQTFKNKQWQAAAQYKANDFIGAAQNFSQFDTADAHYNRGNALAKAGKLDEAINAYEKALEKQPDMEDALFNKQLVEKLKQRQQQNSSDQNNKDGSSTEQSQNNNQQHQNKQPGNKQQQTEQQQSNQPQGDNNPDNAEQSQRKNQQNQQQQNNKQSAQGENDGADLPEQQQADQAKQQLAKQQEKQQSEEQKSREQASSAAKNNAQATAKKPQAMQREQARFDKENQQKQQVTEQWLRQIPDEPAGLLRRKFDYEHRLRQQQQTEPQREQPKW